VVYRRVLRGIAGRTGTCRIGLVDSCLSTFAAALLCHACVADLCCLACVADLCCYVCVADLRCYVCVADLRCYVCVAEQSNRRRSSLAPNPRGLRCPLLHSEVVAGEVELGFGLADAFVDYQRAVACVEAVDGEVGSAVA
jgi:hypothetical protein